MNRVPRRAEGKSRTPASALARTWGKPMAQADSNDTTSPGFARQEAELVDLSGDELPAPDRMRDASGSSP